MKNKPYFTAIGRYFGYPECCIEDFNSRENALTINEDQQKANSNGFIPCPACSKEIVEGKVTIDELIKDRIHPEKFPNDDYRLLKSYLTSQTQI